MEGAPKVTRWENKKHGLLRNSGYDQYTKMPNPDKDNYDPHISDGSYGAFVFAFLVLGSSFQVSSRRSLGLVRFATVQCSGFRMV